MPQNNSDVQTCDTCNRQGDDLDLETTLQGDSICAQCRERKRDNTDSRDLGQRGLPTGGDADE